jgi:hypothetical protein
VHDQWRRRPFDSASLTRDLAPCSKRSDAPYTLQNKTNKQFSLFGAGHQLAKLRCKSLSLLSLHVYASSGFSDDDHVTATTARLEPAAAAAAAALGSMRSVGLALAV